MVLKTHKQTSVVPRIEPNSTHDFFDGCDRPTLSPTISMAAFQELCVAIIRFRQLAEAIARTTDGRCAENHISINAD
ncbi:unnamed protein product [Leptosia nina]|uniref:Uncharacterized protein n=1 Tax=Leptosia nina TaxID=320188 RepID=A0AAV1ITS4_9NEOP